MANPERARMNLADLYPILEGAKWGNTTAMERLVGYFGKDLWQFFQHRLSNTMDAEDLYQDTWTTIFEKIQSLRDGNQFRSWAFAIAINKVRSHFKRQKPATPLDDHSDLPSSERDGERATLASQRKDALLLALAELSDRERDMVVLDCVIGLPQAEIAHTFEENLNTVKTVIRRAKIKLAKHITGNLVP